MNIAMPGREHLRTAIALAVRAPSAHNTQPWRWRIDDGSVHLFADWARHVPAGDPGGRDLLISCGAALHHFRVAAAALGWATAVHRLPDPAAPEHLAALEFRPHQPSDRDIAAAAAIRRRHTDRRRMSSLPVPPDHLRLIAARARAHGALAVPVVDPAARFALAGAIAQAAVIQANAFPRGTLTAPPGKRYGQQTELVVVATAGDDVLSRLRAGEATSAALLAATELGLATCPLSEPLEIAGSRGHLRDRVLGGAAEPQLVIRLGWAPTTAARLPATPRRTVDEVIRADAGGSKVPACSGPRVSRSRPFSSGRDRRRRED
ncbi:Acg family FMN-binding oxidoreductase [Actinophytocola sp. KF-1]